MATLLKECLQGIRHRAIPRGIHRRVMPRLRIRRKATRHRLPAMHHRATQAIRRFLRSTDNLLVLFLHHPAIFRPLHLLRSRSKVRLSRCQHLRVPLPRSLRRRVCSQKSLRQVFRYLPRLPQRRQLRLLLLAATMNLEQSEKMDGYWAKAVFITHQR